MCCENRRKDLWEQLEMNELIKLIGFISEGGGSQFG
jgi:ribosome-associated protein YbcJ (S4-like RNA binding protein)